MKPISSSSDKSPAPDSGATDLLWPPSWWRWLIFALNGTLEIERQFALKEMRHRQRMIELRESNKELQKSNEELQKINEEARKNDEEARIAHEQRMKELRKETEELRQKNKRLAELESKLNEILHS
jgi:predicted nuclease with TOPRIM domain